MNESKRPSIFPALRRAGEHARPLAFGAAVLAALIAPARGASAPSYESEIRPLFAKRCTACHNAKSVEKLDLSGGLALDSFDAVMRGASGKAVVVAGKAPESELLRRLETPDEDERMPLSEDPLSAEQRDLVRRWIDAGAPRGEVSSTPRDAPSPSPRRYVRSLDVAIPVAAKLPPEALEGAKPGPVEIRLAVGPLPAVSAVAFRGDARILAVGSYGSVVLWDLADARPAAVLADVPGPVHALAFSRDGRRLAVGSGLPARSGSVRVFSIPDGTRVADFEGHGDVVFGLAFRPDGAQLASASFDGTVRLWDLAEGKDAGVFRGHSDFVYDVAYASDGQSLLSASKDRSIKRVDAATVKEIRTYSEHDEDVLTVALRPGGDGFVTAGLEPQIRWWGLDADKSSKKIGGHAGPVHQLAFSGDGRRLISAGGDRSVRLWDGASGAFQKALPGPTEWQYAAALSHDGHFAAAGGWDGLVRVWDADAGRLLGTLVQPPPASPAEPEWLAVAPDGAFAAPEALRPLLRWRVAGAEVPADRLTPLLEGPDRVARSLRGEAVAPPSNTPGKK